MTLDHKTSHKGTFFEIEIYKSYESWINKLSIDVWFIRIGLNIEKIAFNFVQMKFLVNVYTNKKLSFFYIYVW